MHCKYDIMLMYHAMQFTYLDWLWRLTTRGQHVTYILQLDHVSCRSAIELKWMRVSESDWVNDDLWMNRSSGEIQAQVFVLIKCHHKPDNWKKELDIDVHVCGSMMVRWLMTIGMFWQRFMSVKHNLFDLDPSFTVCVLNGHRAVNEEHLCPQHFN